jgi:2-polyprenyl-6-methoxyphenol hydroxylase-like FAD-dependent oxidoreductase
MTTDEQEELASMGIRRWRLQKCLVDACREAGVPIVFGVRVNSIKVREDGCVDCVMSDGTIKVASLYFGADGVKSGFICFLMLKRVGVVCSGQSRNLAILELPF